MAVAQHRIHWPTISPLWQLADSQDPLCAELADAHYSRRTPGSKRFVALGRVVVLHHIGEVGSATWAAVHHKDPRGTWRWRNSLFRNASTTLTSALIEAATLVTYDEWIKRYGALPELPFETEIDIGATAARRSKHHEPGHCYRIARWREVRRIDDGRKVVLEAPTPELLGETRAK